MTMTTPEDWQQICQQIEQASRQSFSISSTHSVSGGCINSAYIIQSDNKSYFVKLNQRDLVSMFKAEFIGLEELAQSNTVTVPQPVLYGVTDNNSFIILEKISFSTGRSASEQKMGAQLAQLHKIKQAFFGWHLNNTIGSSPQINDASDNWISFWIEQRLGFQLSLAEKNGYGGRLIQSGNKLAESLTVFFDDYQPHPSLLHGDLWSGNAAVTESGQPVIFDPACYYGDREADIAMTELFGGFSADFYTAYNNAYPLHSGYSTRKTLYNLYHILNHLNLFGEGYLQQAQNMIHSLLAETS